MRSLRYIVLIAILTSALGACTTRPTSRFHAFHVPDNSLRVAQVVALASREDILATPIALESIMATGVSEAEIQDRMVGAGRVFCCGSPHDEDWLLWIFIPPHLLVEEGDMVEIRSGVKVIRGESEVGPPNIATRVIQRITDDKKQCRWLPDNDRLWRRVLYCDWMKQEGWLQQSDVLFNFWIKPNK